MKKTLSTSKQQSRKIVLRASPGPSHSASKLTKNTEYSNPRIPIAEGVSPVPQTSKFSQKDGPQLNYFTKPEQQQMTLPLRRKVEDLIKNVQTKQTFLSSSSDTSNLIANLAATSSRNGDSVTSIHNKGVKTTTDIDERHLAQSAPSQAKPGTIKRVASNQPQSQNQPHYYSSGNVSGKIKKITKSIDLTTKEIQSPTPPQSNSSKYLESDPVVSGLHEGIQLLQKNLKQFEGKYKDLAKFYSNERLPGTLQKKPKESGTADVLMQNYKAQLAHNPEQAQVYENLRNDIGSLTDNLSQSTLQVLQSQFKEQSDSCIQVKKLAEQISSEIKKVQPFCKGDMYNALQNVTEKLQSQSQKIAQVFLVQESIDERLSQLGKPLKNQNESLRIELNQALQQLDETREKHVKQLSAMDKTITEQRLQNSDLIAKIDLYSNELRQKSQLVYEKEALLQQFMVKDNFKDTSASSVSVEVLAYQTNRFLSAMRRLQKVVHKRQANVQDEKVEFEISKKDLEMTLKSVGGASMKITLSGRESLDGADAQSKELDNLNKQVEQLQKKLRSVESLRNRSEKFVENQVITLTNVKTQMAAFEKVQVENEGQLQNKMKVLQQRLNGLLLQHNELRKIVDKVVRQNNQQSISLKSKDKEMQIVTAEVSLLKSQLKESEIKLKEQIEGAATFRDQATLLSQLASLQDDNQKRVNQIKKAKIDFQTLKNDYNEAVSQNRSQSQQLTLNQQLQDKMQAQMQQTQNQNEKLKRDFDQISNEKVALQTKVDSLAEQLQNQDSAQTQRLQKDNYLTEQNEMLIQKVNQLQNFLQQQQLLKEQEAKEMNQKHQQLSQKHDQTIKSLQDDLQQVRQQFQSQSMTDLQKHEQLEQLLKQQSDQAQIQQEQMKQSLEVKQKEFNKEIVEIQSQNREIQKQHLLQIEQIEKQNTQIESEKQEAIQKFNAVDKIVNTVTHDYNQAQNLIKSQKIQIEQLNNQINEVQDDLKKAIEQLTKLKDTTQTEESSEIQLTAHNEKLNQQVKTLQQRIVNQNQEQQQQEEVIQKFRVQISERDDQIVKLSGQIGELQQQIQELELVEQERIQTMEEHLGLIQQLKKQLQKSLESNKEYKSSNAELTKVREELQIKCSSLNALLIEANQEKIAIVSRPTQSLEKTKLLKIIKDLQNLRMELTKLKQAVVENKIPQDQIVSTCRDHVQSWLQENSQLKKQLEEAVSKSQSSSNQVQTYMNSMKQHFFDQEAHIKSLNEQNLRTKTQLEQQLQEEKLKLELLQLEFTAEKQDHEALREQLTDISEEMMAKNELIEEANNFISEFHEEKHHLKAKFKFLIGCLHSNDASSYKSSDEVDIDRCFEILEQELMQRSHQESKILQDLVFTHTKSEVKEDMTRKQECVSDNEKVIQLLKEKLVKAEQLLESNGKEFFQQLTKAQNLIKNYKNSSKKFKVINEEFQQQNRLLKQQIQTSSEQIESFKSQINEKNLNILALESKNRHLVEKINELEIQVQSLPEKNNSISFASSHNNSLAVENAQLLQRLQKCEEKLQQARQQSGTSIGQIDPNVIEQKLDSLRKKFIICFEALNQDLNKKVMNELAQIKQNFVADCITIHNIAQTTTVESWNDQVELVGYLQINQQKHYVLYVKLTNQICVVQESQLSESAIRFIRGYTNDIESMVITTDEDFKVLKDLVKDLSVDLLELRQEYVQYMADLRLEHVERSEVALMDEIEYLTGENRDLHLKSKQLCIQNAALKLQIIDQVRGDASIVETPLQAQEQSFMSEQDSFRGVVENMDIANYSIEKLEQQLQNKDIQIKDLHEQLNQISSKTDQNLQDISQTSDASITLQHIKGTLIQFLQKTPYTDKQNEPLLKPIYSMLMFTPQEISELQNARSVLSSSNGVKNGTQNKQNRTDSNSRSQVTDELDSETTEKRVKKGIMSLFQKTVKNQSGEKQKQMQPLVQPMAPQRQPKSNSGNY